MPARARSLALRFCPSVILCLYLHQRRNPPALPLHRRHCWTNYGPLRRLQRRERCHAMGKSNWHSQSLLWRSRKSARAVAAGWGLTFSEAIGKEIAYE
jgi:hypothetical protein